MEARFAPEALPAQVCSANIGHALARRPDQHGQGMPQVLAIRAFGGHDQSCMLTEEAPKDVNMFSRFTAQRCVDPMKKDCCTTICGFPPVLALGSLWVVRVTMIADLGFQRNAVKPI